MAIVMTYCARWNSERPKTGSKAPAILAGLFHKGCPVMKMGGTAVDPALISRLKRLCVEIKPARAALLAVGYETDIGKDTQAGGLSPRYASRFVGQNVEYAIHLFIIKQAITCLEDDAPVTHFVNGYRQCRVKFMTDVSMNGPLMGERVRNTAQDVVLPKPQPFGAPVFLNDCASPLAGETVLSLLMKRLAAQD